MKSTLRTLVAVAFILAAISTHQAPALPDLATPEDPLEGSVMLFDGHSMAGWQPLGRPGTAITGWRAEDGVLKLARGAGGGDIVTADSFEDFDLHFEWRVAAGSNSGLKYNLLEPGKSLGCEYQLLDDAGHPDAKVGPQRQSAALYDVLPPSPEKKLLPVGEWNKSRLIVRGNLVEHWLNGVKVVDYELGSAELQTEIAMSKFRAVRGFGLKKKSPLLLQDHGDEIFFRNIRIRSL